MNYEFSPWVICAAFSLTGGVLGAVLDLYRVIRFFFRPGRWLTACGDILYWTMVTAVLFGLFGIVVNGELRLYFFLFLLMGMGIYYCWFSRFLIKIYRTVGKWILTVLRICYRLIARVLQIILTPIVWLGNLLRVPLGWLAAPFISLLRWIKGWRKPTEPPLE